MSFHARTTARHVRFATGYIGLGMMADAGRELDAIAAEDREAAEVLGAFADLHMAAKAWVPLAAVAQRLARRAPAEEKGWIHWAYALRELDRIEEARAVLLEAEPVHGKSSTVLHYNLACYHCLLGNKREARRRLRIAFEREEHWRAAALADHDLRAMWDEIAAMA